MDTRRERLCEACLALLRIVAAAFAEGGQRCLLEDDVAKCVVQKELVI
jgi:hypothetical protein